VNNNKIDIHKLNIEKRKESITKWRVHDVEKKQVLRFLEELELGKVNKGVKVCEARQAKYIDSLKISLEFIGKPCTQWILKDVEEFEKALSSGKVKSKIKNKEYTLSTKIDLRRVLKIYLRWRLGKAKADKLTDWLDTRACHKTPDYLKEEQVERLFKNCKSSYERFLIAVLFDTGARAGEFHNIRYEDIELPENGDNFVKITLKEEYSKTMGRTISLYWKHSLEAVRDYLKEREIEGIKSDEPVYKGTYDSARFFLIRLGKKILGRSVHFHLFRHSSATYYATRLNRQELCYRFGWKFSSGMPDVYISRSGMQNKDLDEKFTSTGLEELKVKLEKQEQTNQILKEKQEQLEKTLINREEADHMLNQIFQDKDALKRIITLLKQKGDELTENEIMA